jgi:hypothetical protein
MSWQWHSCRFPRIRGWNLSRAFDRIEREHEILLTLPPSDTGLAVGRNRFIGSCFPCKPSVSAACPVRDGEPHRDAGSAKNDDRARKEHSPDSRNAIVIRFAVSKRGSGFVVTKKPQDLTAHNCPP